MTTLILDQVTSMCCMGFQKNLFHKVFPNKNNQNNDDDEAEVVKPTMTKPQGMKKPTLSNEDSKYELVAWNKLPKKQRLAAETLGFTKETWDGDDWAPTADKWWEDLSTDEQTAATTLGWDITSWDNQYEDHDFDELPANVQKAATTLGFTKEMWDDDSWPEDTHKHWTDLKEEQKRAAHVLGYTKHEWDH